MSNSDAFPARKPLLVTAALLAQAFACSGGNDFAATNTPDASTAEDSGDNTNIVANPNDDANAHDAGMSPTGVDATTGLPSIDAAGPEAASADVADAGVTDATGPDAPACPSMELACDGGCIADDVHNCGGCGKTCATPANGAATCSASAGTYACGVSCSTSYTHCATSCVNLQTDAKNCGSCGHDCIGGTCSAGTCQRWTVAKTSGNCLLNWRGASAFRSQMVTDGKYVAWVDPRLGILDVPIAGGTVKTLAARSDATNAVLTIAGGVVAWTITDTSSNATAVWTAKEDGGGDSGMALASVTTGPNFLPDNIALDPTGTRAYFIADPGDQSAPGVLYECKLAPPTVQTCTSIRNLGPAAAGAPNDVIVAGANIYWTDSGNSSVWAVDFSQGTPAAIATQLPFLPTSLTADSSYLYWGSFILSDAADHLFSIDRTALTNPTTVQLVPETGGSLVGGIAGDGTNIYFSNYGALDYVPVGGGPVRSVFSSAYAFAVSVAGGAIYWLDNDTNIYGLRFP